MNFVARTEGKIQVSEYKTKDSCQSRGWLKDILLWSINNLYCSIRSHLPFGLLYVIWKKKQILNSQVLWEMWISCKEKKNHNSEKQNQKTKTRSKLFPDWRYLFSCVLSVYRYIHICTREFEISVMGMFWRLAKLYFELKIVTKLIFHQYFPC